jgi:hypothetical protein
MKTYYWQTEQPHVNNNETMADFLENHLGTACGEGAETLLNDGTYAEIFTNGELWAAHVSGNGDFTNHKAEFELLAEDTGELDF